MIEFVKLNQNNTYIQHTQVIIKILQLGLRPSLYTSRKNLQFKDDPERGIFKKFFIAILYLLSAFLPEIC